MSDSHSPASPVRLPRRDAAVPARLAARPRGRDGPGFGHGFGHGTPMGPGGPQVRQDPAQG